MVLGILGRGAAFLGAIGLAAAVALAQPSSHRTAHAFECNDSCAPDIQFETDPFIGDFGFPGPGVYLPATGSADQSVRLTVAIQNFGGYLSAAATSTFTYFPDALEIDLPANVNVGGGGMSGQLNNFCTALGASGCNGVPTSAFSFTPQCHYHGAGLGSIQSWTCDIGQLHRNDWEAFQTNIVLPHDGSTGITATVKIDPNWVLPRSGPDPVTATASTTILYPDLTASFDGPPNPPATIRSGSDFTYAVTMDNIGIGSTGIDRPVVRLEVDPSVHFTGFTVTGSGTDYLCTERHPTTFSNRRWVDCEVAPLDSGHNVVLTANVSAPLATGPVTAIATADPDNRIAEVYEGNNSQTIVTQLISDTTPPVVTGTFDRPADSNGWYRLPVSAKWSGTDPDDASSSLTCSPPSLYAGPDGSGVVLNGHCADPSGNTGHGTLALNYDASPPSVACQPADASWHGADVSIACTAADGGSGLANPADARFTLTTSVAAGTDNANASTNSHQVCDVAGNCATAGPISGNMIDKAPPVVSCGSADGIWHATDVTIACTASDSASGLQFGSDASFTLSTNVASGATTSNAATDSRTVCDVAGNCVTAGPISGNMIDKAPPSLSCVQPDSQWHAADVLVSCTATDGGSGLGSAADATFTLTTSVATGTETASASTNSHEVCDAVGNCATAGPYTGLKVDKSAPTLACGSADALWHAADVTIGCSAADGGSGLASAADASFGLSTSVAAGTETANASTGSHQVCDAVGNCATAGPVAGNKIDKAPPSIACGSADGVWHATDVSIGCTTSDSGSGLATAADSSFGLSTTVAAGTETANASTGSRSVCDAVGNCATAGPIAGNKIDKKAPVTTATPARVPALPGMPTVQVDITKVTITPGGSLGPITCWSSPGVVVNLAALDGGSGPASITYSISGAQLTAPTTVPGGQATVTVSKLGASTITYFATDRVGNVEASKKVLILNGGVISCATVPQAVTVPVSGTANIVGTLTVTYGSTTIVKPFNVTFPFNLTRD
jgi:hypothetical protein